MSFKEREHQKMIRLYQEETGNYVFELAEVAAWAAARGWEMPIPPTSVEMLARQLQRAARAETRPSHGSPLEHRVNHAYTEKVNGETRMKWFDIDGPAATKPKVRMALLLRRKQALNDCVHIAIDRIHWNSSRPPEDQIEMDFNLDDEVTWTLNAPTDEAEERKAS